jgi:glycerol-3-phosphate dehydrogenase (NAD(P)+)
MRRLTILGAGSWGLTLAWLWARAGLDVTLWDRRPEKCEALCAQPNRTFPVVMTLPPTVRLASNLHAATEKADIVVLAVTTQGTREVLQGLADAMPLDTILLNVSKGIELPTLQRLQQVAAEVCPRHAYASLSGPTLAQEVLDGMPTAAVVASTQADVAEALQETLSCENRFRLYSNTDVAGVELGGALKNIFAIASGYMVAKGLGENARAALITRGLAEMTRFASHLGAEEATLYGLSGLGDLLATCGSPLSRNYQVGYALGHDEPLPDILTRLRVVAEGVQSARAVETMAQQQGLDMPIVGQVVRSLEGQLSSEMMIKSLMSRKLKPELTK